MNCCARSGKRAHRNRYRAIEIIAQMQKAAAIAGIKIIAAIAIVYRE